MTFTASNLAELSSLLDVAEVQSTAAPAVEGTAVVPKSVWAQVVARMGDIMAPLTLPQLAAARAARMHSESTIRAFIHAYAQMWVTGNKSAVNDIIDALGFCTQKETRALEDVAGEHKPAWLRHDAGAAMREVSRMAGEVRAILAPVKVAKARAKPADYKGAYAALAAHCAANGVAVPATQQFGF
jgi:hypothetical protein